MKTVNKDCCHIAAFIPYPHTKHIERVIFNCDQNKGVEKGDMYFINENSDDNAGDDVALLKVFKVHPKIAEAKVLWVSKKCPILKLGWNVFLWKPVINNSSLVKSND